VPPEQETQSGLTTRGAGSARLRIGVAGTERVTVWQKSSFVVPPEWLSYPATKTTCCEAVMFAKNRKLPDFRDDYANWSDFCQIFDCNEKEFYLLAFLLTADHQTAEACVLAAMEESYRERTVFRGWEKVWSKRCIIIKAISAIASRPLSRDRRLEDGGTRLGELELGNLLGAVVRLEPAERGVFVVTVLERYSVQECSLLLGRSPESVKKLKLQAIGDLSEFAGQHISDAGFSAAGTGRQWATAPQRRKARPDRYLNSPCFASIWRGTRSPRLA